jgi:hypothetical protein
LIDSIMAVPGAVHVPAGTVLSILSMRSIVGGGVSREELLLKVRYGRRQSYLRSQQRLLETRTCWRLCALIISREKTNPYFCWSNPTLLYRPTIYQSNIKLKIYTRGVNHCKKQTKATKETKATMSSALTKNEKKEQTKGILRWAALFLGELRDGLTMVCVCACYAMLC